MTKHILSLLSLALPLLFLAGSIAFHVQAQKSATLWRIPVSSFDPYLPLRGHYFRFTYNWQLLGDPELCTAGSCTLCLSEKAGTVIARMAPAGSLCPHPLRLPAGNVAPGGSADGGLSFNGRIFVSEKSAPRLEASLQDGKAMLVARLTTDGTLVPQQLLPRHPLPTPR